MKGAVVTVEGLLIFAFLFFGGDSETWAENRPLRGAMADANFINFLRKFAALPPDERPYALLNEVGIPAHLIATELPKFEQFAVEKGFKLRGAPGPLDVGPISLARVRVRSRKARSFYARGAPPRPAPLSLPQSPPCSTSTWALARRAPPYSLPPPLPPRALSYFEQLWEVTWGRTLQWGGAALFWGAVPLVLFLIKERRGLSWEGLAAQALRLPFAD
jgi:hypothetical protein